LSPLTNIARGTIELSVRPPNTDVRYTIVIDRTPFVAAIFALVVGLLFGAFGVRQFEFFSAFGAVILILSTGLSFIIRLRFRRWLQRICESTKLSDDQTL